MENKKELLYLLREFAKECSTTTAYYGIIHNSIVEAIANPIIKEGDLNRINDRNIINLAIRYRNVSLRFVERNKDILYWPNVLRYKAFNIKSLRKYIDYLNWRVVSSYQKLDEAFVIEFEDYLTLTDVFTSNRFKESFIERFKNKVSLYTIFKYQNVSKKFILENIDYSNFISIAKYQKIKLKDFSYFDSIILRSSWMYKSTLYKKNKIINTKLYECHDDYFIAYKNIRKDRYSHYNFQFRYIKGRSYKAKADYTNEEYSFGLSVWTKEEAENYVKGGMVVKCLVYYKDVARLIMKDKKIRCIKITVLE